MSTFPGVAPRTLRLDLVDRVDHGVEGQQRGGVARLVVAHRFEHRDVGPFAVRGRCAVLLQHLAHGLAQALEFVGFCPDDVARHDRRRRLPERAGLHLMGEVRHGVALHFQVDRHGGTAQLGMRGRGGVRLLKPANSRDCARQFENPAVIDVVEHAILARFRRNLAMPIDCRPALGNYIGVGRQAGNGGPPSEYGPQEPASAKLQGVRRPYRVPSECTKPRPPR